MSECGEARRDVHVPRARPASRAGWAVSGDGLGFSTNPLRLWFNPGLRRERYIRRGACRDLGPLPHSLELAALRPCEMPWPRKKLRRVATCSYRGRVRRAARGWGVGLLRRALRRVPAEGASGVGAKLRVARTTRSQSVELKHWEASNLRHQPADKGRLTSDCRSPGRRSQAASCKAKRGVQPESWPQVTSRIGLLVSTPQIVVCVRRTKKTPAPPPQGDAGAFR